MDNNLNLWSGIELTWENILARTFYGTDIYSHILQTYYPRKHPIKDNLYY